MTEHFDLTINFNDSDIKWMLQALAEANKTRNFGEVPVGAVITRDDTLLAAAGNSPISANDPTAHAEISAIRKAAAISENYRLAGTTLYVTLEPCLMCMGAIIHARIERLVFGSFDPKTGAAVSRYKIGSDGLLNHTLKVEGGLLADQCGEMLRSFFRSKRSGS